MHDLRPQLLAPRDAQGNPLTVKHWFGLGIMVVIAAGLLATPRIPREVTVLVAAFVATMAVSFAGMRRRPPVVTRATALEPVTEIAVSRLRPLGGIALFAVFGYVAGLAALRALESEPVLAVGVGLVAAAMVWFAVLLATAPDTRGVVGLSPSAVTYAGPRFRAALAWDDVAAVLADEARMVTRIALPPGTPVMLSRNPGWPGRLRTGAPEVLSIPMHGMALLPTDLARVVVHYAGAPGARSELGTEAARTRIEAVLAQPVTDVVLQLDVERPGVRRTGTDQQQSAPRPAQRALMLATVRENAAFAVGALRAVVVVGSFATVLGLALVVGGWGDGYAVSKGAVYLVVGLPILVISVRAVRRTRRAAAEVVTGLDRDRGMPRA